MGAGRRCHSDDSAVFRFYAFNLFAEAYFTAQRLHLVCKRFPELTGTFFGIYELLYQRSLDVFLVNVVFLHKRLFQHCAQCLHERQSFDALRAPVGGNIARVDAPYLFGVILKEHLIKRLAEAVDIKICEVVLFFLEYRRPYVAEARLHRVGKAHVLQRFAAHGDGICEEFLEEIYARNAGTHQHHAVFLFGIGTALFKRLFPAEYFVVECGRALDGHMLLPEVHDLVVFGKEAVSADIHAVTVVNNGLRYTADHVRFFKDYRLYIGFGEQLVGGCKPCGAGADYDCCFH